MPATASDPALALHFANGVKIVAVLANELPLDAAAKGGAALIQRNNPNDRTSAGDGPPARECAVPARGRH